MSQVVSLRLPDETADRLKRCARREGRTVNETAARSLEEWLRQEEFADIEFRSFGAERHACIKGYLPVWQLIIIAREYNLDAGKTAAYFHWPISRIKAGLHYYEAYPEEIDKAIEDNEAASFDTLKRLLPNLEGIRIPQSVLDGR